MPLIQARAGFGQRRGFRIEIDVVGDEQVQVAVLIVIDETRSRYSSAAARCRDRW